MLSALFAFLLVAAQSSWKVAVDAHEGVFQRGVSFRMLAAFLFSPLIIVGVVIYVFATLLYLYLLSRYHFSTVQALAIPLSLLFSVTVAQLFFGDKLSSINFIGIALIAVGIILVVLKVK